MQRIIGGVLAALVLGAPTAVRAESRPIEQLPKDAAHLSTAWTVVPEQIAQVNRAYGPVAALTWGPVQGAAAMAWITTSDLWQSFRPDRTPGHGQRDGVTKAALLRYEF